MAVIGKDGNGKAITLQPSALSLGVGVNDIGKEFEVAGNMVSRSSGDSGGTALALAAEGNGLCSIWTNNSYNPAKPGSGWMRTINLMNGNVGIGGPKDPVAQAPSERLVVAGNIVATGDIRLSGGDCAEDFPVDEAEPIEPGAVMVIADEDTLRQCAQGYDKRVAGVVSGAGGCRPGILLGQHRTDRLRLPLALNGKVYCKVDARYGGIAVGDLLTTSPTPGHAMRASDFTRACGAVLGKALRSLAAGQDLIPVLVALQ